MRQYATPHTVAAEVRMMRTQHKGALLIVEGPTDKIVFYRLLDQIGCRIVIAQGKKNAQTALQILEGESFPGVLAVVDADFSRVEGAPTRSRNLLSTDLHDLECMMIASPAFQKVLSEYAKPERLEQFEHKSGCGLNVLLAKSAMPLGYLRWLSLRDDLGFDFEGLSFGRFLDRRDLHIDTGRLLTEVKNHSQKRSPADSELKFAMQSLSCPSHDPWQVSCGHDMVEILSFALRRTIAARKDLEVKPEVLERDLRFAYERSYFKDTGLYKLIREWEFTHSPYRVLPE
jgi:hypothetical protein